MQKKRVNLTALKTRKVELSNGYLPMLWVLPDLTIADCVEKFEYLKENFGLTQSRLGYSCSLGEATISRILIPPSKLISPKIPTPLPDI